MAFTELLRLVVTADTRGAVAGVERLGSTSRRELSRAEQNLDRWGSRLTTVGAGLLTFGSVAAVGLGMAARSAGELEQAVGGTEAVFGDARGVIDDYAANAADKLGLSETAFRNLTTVAAAQLKNLGFSVEEAAEQSVQLTEIGADLAATFGGTTAEAVDALGAAFRGEADPAERFGLRLNINTANAKAVAMGLAESTSAVDAHARAQAILALIMEQSADAQGQFGREADTLQGRQQRLAAAFENMKAEIGAGVLPAMETLFGVAKGGIGVMSGLNDATGGALGTFATIGTVATLGAGGLSLIAGQVIKMRDHLVAAGQAVSGFTTKMGGIRRVAGIAAGAAGIGALVIALEEWQEAQRNARADELTEEFLAASDSTRVLVEALTGGVRGVNSLHDGFENLIAAGNMEAARRMVSELAEVLGESHPAVDTMRTRLDEAGAAQRQMAADTAGATSAVEAQTEAVQGFSEQLDNLLGQVFSVPEAQANMTLALAAATEEVARQREEFGAAATSMDLNTEAGARNQQTLQGLVESAAGVIEAMQSQGATSAELRGEIDRQVARLYEWAAANGFNRDQVSGLIGQLLAIPSQRSVAVNVNHQEAIAGIAAIQARINELHGRDVGIRIVATQVGFAGGGVRLFHEGGIVPGRRGEEVAAILQAGERVLPLDDPSSRLLPAPGGSPAAGGGGDTFVFDMRGSFVANSPQFDRMVQDAVTRARTRTQGRAAVRYRS